nr:hypothetical protein HK105_000660 [Polyrhizophydium stewartii]
MARGAAMGRDAAEGGTEAPGFRRSLDELGDLLADDAAVDDYVAGLPQVREIHGARMGIVEDNAAIAERNLAKEEEIKDLRQRIKALQDMHASHRRSLDQLLKAQQQELARFGGEHITGTLRELVTSSESMSELSAQSFLEGKLTEDEFIRAFKESRRVYHLRSAKHEAPVFDYDEIDDLEFENLLNTPGLAGPLHARPSSAVFWDSVASLFRLRPNTGLGLSSNAGSAASAASGLFGAGARAYAYGYEALATTAPALGSAGGGGGSLFGIHFGAGTPAAAHAAPAAASDRLDDLDDVLYGGHDEDSRLMTPEEINSITAAAAAARHLYLTDDSGSTLTAGHGAVVTDPLNAAILFADSDNASAANEISDDGDEAFATPQQFDADLLRRLQSVAEQ